MAETTNTGSRTSLSIPSRPPQDGAGSSTAESVRSADATQPVFYASTEEGQATISALAEKLAATFPDASLGASASHRFRSAAESYVIASMDDDEIGRALDKVHQLWHRSMKTATMLLRQEQGYGGGAAAPSTPTPPGARTYGQRATSPAPSTASSSAGSAFKRARTESTAPATSPPAFAAPGALTDDGLSAMGTALCDGLRARRAAAADKHLSLEAECFSPILVEVNQTRRKVCNAIERLCALLVDLPQDQVLAASPATFASAPLQAGADESAPPEERAEMLDEVISHLEALRSAGGTLKRVVGHAMRVFWLANHTTGCGWNTVAQIIYRDDHDNEMLLVQDGHKPIATWEEKVATAMRAIHQDRHLTKEGVPVGPVNPRLVGSRKPGQPVNRESGSAFRGRSSGRGGSSAGRGGRFKRGGSHARSGKENRSSGRAAAAPAAAPGAAAAAAAAGGGG